MDPATPDRSRPARPAGPLSVRSGSGATSPATPEARPSARNSRWPLDVSVVTVSWNTRELLGNCLVSVRKWARSLSTEHIVVDNASSDGSAEMVRRLYSNVHLIANDDNVGYTKGCNQGLAVAQGRYVLFLNPDAELTEGCLQRLVDFMDANPDVGACSPHLDPAGEDVPAGVFPSLRLRLLPVQTNWRIEVERIRGRYRSGECFDVDWLIGACLFMRREALEQIGPMEERLFMWYDDADLGIRLKRAGWRRVVVNGAVCLHHHGASARQVPARQADFRMTMAEYTYWRLHRGRLVTGVLYASRVLRLALKRLLPRGDSQEARDLDRARLRWHLRHGADILCHEPRPYRGEPD